ncbi:MAG: hypothetical protein Q8Q12_19370 [bacterium]|nr:hypothetical protein [bacterium]
MTQETPWYVRHSPEFGRAFRDFHRAANDRGVLDKKTKELLMTALAPRPVRQVRPVGHVGQACRAAVEGAGTQLYWVKEVFEKHLGSDEK